jgi:hypothetical protein
MMSHFSVSVLISNDEYDPRNESVEDVVKRKLAPYQENNMRDCPEEYLEFSIETEEVKDSYEKYDFDGDLEEFAKEYFGYVMNDDGEFGYWHNPNAKWDYWAIGGRWDGVLEVTHLDHPVNSARVKDIQWDEMKEKVRESRGETYDKAFEDMPDKAETREFIYGVRKGESKEEYVERGLEFETFACVDKDGDWYEKGEMGWFGAYDDENADKWDDKFFEEFIEPLDDNDLLVIVDCHT